MDKPSVVITYETLFEILRREKSRGDLQELDTGFFKDIISYLAQKKGMLLKKPVASGLFGEEERMQTESQVLNIKRLIRQLYELRERKIIDMALNRSRTQSNLLDDSALLPEEKIFYETLVSRMDEQRRDLLYLILNAEAQMPSNEPEKKIKEPKKPDVTLKFSDDVEEFVDEEMNSHGPFSSGDVATLPANLAQMLIERHGAERLED